MDKRLKEKIESIVQNEKMKQIAKFVLPSPLRREIKKILVKRNVNVIAREETPCEDVEYDSATPISHIKRMQVEITNKCNLKCKMCHRQKLPQHILNQEIDLKLVEKLIPACQNADYISLSGPSGEPLCSNNLLNILDLVNHYKKDGSLTSLNTNGILLNEELIKNLFKRQLGMIIVSIDGVRSYESLRNIDFTKLLINLLAFRRIKLEMNSITRMVFNFVAMKRTLPDLLDIIDLAHFLEVTEVNIIPLSPPSEEWKKEEIIDDTFSNEMLKKAKGYAEARGLRLIFWWDFEKENKQFGSNIRVSAAEEKINTPLCDFPFNYIMVTPNGKVWPCCGFYGTLESSLNEATTLDEIWNGREYTELRKKLSAGIIPSKCTNCTLLRKKFN